MEILIRTPEFAFPTFILYFLGQGQKPMQTSCRHPQSILSGSWEPSDVWRKASLTDEGEREKKAGSLEKEGEWEGHP